MAFNFKDLDKILTTKQAKEVGAPYFKVNTDPDQLLKTIKSDDGIKRIKLIASSNDVDLVGDVMTEKALKRMESAAPGTTMFLNHNYSIPDSVFGVVEKAQLTVMDVDVDGQVSKCLALVYHVKVAASNPAALRTYDLIDNEEAQLGASIGILITDADQDRKSGLQLINDVKYLECSIVGIPCNNSRAWVQGAVKALQKMFPAQSRTIVGAQPTTPADVLALSAKASEGAAPKGGGGIIPANTTAVEIDRPEIFVPAVEQKETEKPKVRSAAEIFEFMKKDSAPSAFAKARSVSVKKKEYRDMLRKGFKSFYQDTYTETITDPYFLVSLMYSALYDLKAAARRGDVKSEELESLLEQGFDEFKTLGVPAFLAAVEAAIEAGDDYWYCYSLGMDTAVMKNLVSAAAVVSKSGKKISADTMKSLQSIHDECVKMGVTCSVGAGDGDEPDDATKGVSTPVIVAATTDASSAEGESAASQSKAADEKTASLQIKMGELLEVVAKAEEEISAKDAEIKSLKEELDALRASNLSMQLFMTELEEQPLS